MEKTLQVIAEHLNGRVIGDGTILIHGVNNSEMAHAGELTFAMDTQRLAEAIASQASAVIVSSDVQELSGRSGISVENPKLAFAQALELFHPTPTARATIHPTAVLGQSVECHGAELRAHAVVGDHVRIGQGTIVEPGAYIGDHVTMGQDCLIGPNVVIYHQTQIGDRVRIHGGSVVGGDGFGYVFHQGRYVKVPQVGNVVIQDDVEIGCNVCVDRATVGSTIIQQGTKIDNQVQIAHNDRIGRHVVLAGHVGLSGSVVIGDYTVLGGKAGVVDHVTIGPQVKVGAASVVTKSIPANTSVWGYPARPIDQTKEQMASLSRLPGLFGTIRQLLARITRLEEQLATGYPRSRSIRPRTHAK